MDDEIEALYNEGVDLFTGESGKKDTEKGLRLLKKAADKGHVKAAVTVGFLLNLSQDKKRNQEGFRYTKQAAEAGDALAMGNLANYYLYGKGTRKDKHLAKVWYTKAADLGMASSAMQLGTMYHEEGDDDKAYTLFKKAAEAGFAPAMGWLASCYYNGWGTEENLGLSRMWLEKAAALGDKEAPEALRRYFNV